MGPGAKGPGTIARPAGFTLVEVIIATFLMGIALVYAAPLFLTAIKENAAGADFGSVGAMAVDRMERLRAVDFYGLTAGGSLSGTVTGYSDTTNAAFTVRWQITDNGSPATEKTVAVRVVAARQVMGAAKEITLTTVRSR